MYQINEDKKFKLVIVSVMLSYGLYLAFMVNHAFASPGLIHSVIIDRGNR